MSRIGSIIGSYYEPNKDSIRLIGNIVNIFSKLGDMKYGVEGS